MKKSSIKKIIILGVLLFIFPVLVFADMGAPMISSYEAIITNKDGAQAVDWQGKKTKTYNYDDKIEVKGEITIKGEIYAEIDSGNWNSDYIPLKDINPLEKEIDLNKFQKEEHEVYVFNEGVYLYKGPSVAYGKVEEETEIPVGTTLKYEYSDEMWAFVEYNGVKGWIYKYTFLGFDIYDFKCGIAEINNTNEVYTIKDIELVSSPITGEKSGETIPAGVKLKYKYYYYAHPKNVYVYLSYKGKEGWYETSYAGDSSLATVDSCASIYNTKDTVTLYEKPNTKAKTTIATSKVGDILYPEYQFLDDDWINTWYFVKIGNKSGWINIEEYANSQYVSSSKHLTRFKLKKDVTLYDVPNGKTIDKTIASGETVELTYNYNTNSDSWYYAPDYEGWIKVNYKEYEYIDNKEICTKPTIPEEEPAKEEKEDEKEDTNNKDNKISPIEIAIICVGGAIVLVIVSVVSIKLIKKSKNKAETIDKKEEK